MPKSARSVFIKASAGTGIKIKQVLGGHLCRCAADGIRTLKDTASHVRGEATL